MKNNFRTILLGLLVSVVALFTVYGYFFGTVLPYLQGREYLIKTKIVNTPDVILDDKLIFEPYTSAQSTIRELFLVAVLDQYMNGTLKAPNQLLDGAMDRMAEYAERFPIYYNYYLLLAKGYNTQAKLRNDASLFSVADTYYKRALELAPGRQDVIYSYALNLIDEGKPEEGVAMLRASIAETPTVAATHYRLAEVLTVFGPSRYDEAMDEFEYALDRQINLDPQLVVVLYQKFFYHYFQKGDPVRFAVSARRLAVFDAAQRNAFLTVAEYAEQHHVVPDIDIKQEGN